MDESSQIHVDEPKVGPGICRLTIQQRRRRDTPIQQLALNHLIQILMYVVL